MKRLIFLSLFLAAGLAWSQTRTQIMTGVTSTGDSTDVANLTGTPAIGWRLNFYYTGASCTGVTVQLDCAPDNGSGAAGTYGACGGAVDGTTNPVTVSSGPHSQTIALKTYTPHIAVNPTSLSGSGCSLNWNLTGLFGAFNVPTTVTTSGGGGGGTTVSQSVCDPANGGAEKTTVLSGTGFNSLVGATSGQNIQVCNIVVTSASGGTPNVNTFTFATGNCAGSPTTAAILAGVTGYTDEFFGTLTTGASNDLCLSESVGNGDTVFVSYWKH